MAKQKLITPEELEDRIRESRGKRPRYAREKLELSSEAHDQFLLAQNHVRKLYAISEEAMDEIDLDDKASVARVVNLSLAAMSAQRTIVQLFGVDYLKTTEQALAHKEVDLDTDKLREHVFENGPEEFEE